MKELRRIRAIAESCLTPFYIFDEQAVSLRIDRIRRALPKGTLICYAMKANPFILKTASRETDLVEACSPGELSICRSMGVPDNRLVVSGVYKERLGFQKLISQKTHIYRYTAESIAQFELLSLIARQTKAPISVLLRLTSGNQFGMDASDLKRIALENKANRFVSIRGIQFFSGTQKRSVKKMRRELEALDLLAEELRGTCGSGVLEIEYGPGLAVSYSQESQISVEADEQEFLDALADSLEKMRFAGTMTLEVGRGIAAACGIYVTQIVDVKKNGGRNYAIVDGGKHQLSYYDPELAFRSPVCHLLAAKSGGSMEDWTICGSLCTANDLMVRQLSCPGLQIGDYLAFPNAGAYCMAEGPALLLSRDLPSVYLCKNLTDLRLVRGRMQTSAWNTPRNYIPV